jgi:hypothetical protein
MRLRGVWRIEQALVKQRERRLLRAAQRAVARFPIVRNRQPHGLTKPLIVTLTSYAPRFQTLALTLRSLLDQSIAPDRTILWLAKGDQDQLPREVHALEQHGLEIRLCDNLLSYKKLIPAWRAYPDSFLVTADDDVYYPREWLATLLAGIEPQERAVVGARAHLARFDVNGHALPYASWDLVTTHRRATTPNTRLFPTGVGGILYPPGSLAPQVDDEATFMALCPTGDDIWFFWMARLAGATHVGTPEPFDLIPWPSSQQTALWTANLEGDGNDRQIQAMQTRFGPAP